MLGWWDTYVLDILSGIPPSPTNIFSPLAIFPFFHFFLCKGPRSWVGWLALKAFCYGWGLVAWVAPPPLCLCRGDWGVFDTTTPIDGGHDDFEFEKCHLSNLYLACRQCGIVTTKEAQDVCQDAGSCDGSILLYQCHNRTSGLRSQKAASLTSPSSS